FLLDADEFDAFWEKDVFGGTPFGYAENYQWSIPFMTFGRAFAVFSFLFNNDVSFNIRQHGSMTNRNGHIFGTDELYQLGHIENQQHRKNYHSKLRNLVEKL